MRSLASHASPPAVLAVAAYLAATGFVQAQTTILDFDDGTNEVSINNFYGRSGVVFSNATWFPNISCNTCQPFPGASPGAFIISRQIPLPTIASLISLTHKPATQCVFTEAECNRHKFPCTASALAA